MDKEKIRQVLIRAENIICCDCEPEKRIPCIKYPECAGIRELRECILELDKPKPYYPLGQEPMSETCLSCTLQCPTDCPLDKQN